MQIKIKSGYVVLLRNNKHYMAMPCKKHNDCGMVLYDGKNNFMYLDRYDKSWCHIEDSQYDILAVYGYADEQNTLTVDSKGRELLWVWKRKMTIKEIEDRLGFPVEIVEER